MSDVNRILSIPQSEFYESDSKYTAAVAGFGSGKTDVALTRMLKNMTESPGIDQAYLAPTYALIRDIWFPKVEDFLDEMGVKYKINQQECNIRIQGLGTVYCRTMEKPERLIGWQVADAFLDEFDVLPTDKAMNVLRKITARLRQDNPSGRKNQLFFTTTPEGFKATYNIFVKNPMTDSRLIKMSTYSNEENLPDDYIQTLRDQYPSQLIEAYINGEFVNLQSGTVYYAFDRDKHNTHYVTKPREPIHVGMDFNVHDMCASIHVRRDGNLYATDELMGLRDTPDMCDALKEKFPDHKISVYPDASGSGTSSKSASQSDLKILKDAGFIVRALTKNPLIKNRVASVNKQFEIGRYYVNVDRCPELALAFEQQAYNPVTGQPEKDGSMDNRVDGAGYLQNFINPVQHRQAKQRKLGGF